MRPVKVLQHREAMVATYAKLSPKAAHNTTRSASSHDLTQHTAPAPQSCTTLSPIAALGRDIVDSHQYPSSAHSSMKAHNAHGDTPRPWQTCQCLPCATLQATQSSGASTLPCMKGEVRDQQVCCNKTQYCRAEALTKQRCDTSYYTLKHSTHVAVCRSAQSPGAAPYPCRADVLQQQPLP
jgi:hypothetical protein